MAFSFDENEFAEGNEAEAAAEDALQSLEASPEAVDSGEDPELADVDLRLETADYYRAILSHDFFETTSPAAQVVDREIRTFIRERLEVLLGIRAPRHVPSQFDDDEVEALRLLADPKVATALSMLAEKVWNRGSAAKDSSPAVKKMPTPVAKVTGKPAPKRRVEVKRPPPPPVKPRVGTKPVEKKSAPEQKPAPVVPAAKPAKTRVVDRTIDNGESQTFISHSGKKVTLVEGEVIEEDGRRYVVARNEAGTLYRRDITGQVVAPGRLPPMSAQQMSVISHQMAEQQLSLLDETTGLAIVAALQQQ